MDTDTKVILITGGSSGIGAATAKLFSEKGYKVAIHGRNQNRIEQVAKECENLSPNKYKILTIITDLSDLDNCQSVIEQTIRGFGRLDVLVNNAARFRGCDIGDFKEYKAHMTLNLDCHIKITMHAIPYIKKTLGNIIFISSIDAERPVPWNAPYATAKGCLNCWAACLALDLAPHVRVNTLSPGAVNTPMLDGIFDQCPSFTRDDYTKVHPTRRFAEVSEIAKAIYFLSSQDASFVNGSKLIIDGGYQWVNYNSL